MIIKVLCTKNPEATAPGFNQIIYEETMSFSLFNIAMQF